ncbi:MAG TPA: hypothetical protein VJJ23_05085 [Candidatus Nanoarchaeia archaeon]|nr:hypothetical protein [Candidatus Nanoarchaeia archaeon]
MKKLTEMIKENRKIELVIGGISLFILLLGFINFNSNLVLVSPKDVVTQRQPEFSWSGSYDNYNLIVENENNPLVNVTVDENYYRLENQLPFGVYYWYVIAEEKKSETVRFELRSIVAIKQDNGILNEGNSRVKVDYEEDGITGAAILDVNSLLKKNITKARIEQDE